ncbi:MAG: hypothetical protein NVSMB4_05110 [Acidimicrobiales bacterium]
MVAGLLMGGRQISEVRMLLCEQCAHHRLDEVDLGDRVDAHAQSVRALDISRSADSMRQHAITPVPNNTHRTTLPRTYRHHWRRSVGRSPG